MTDGKVAQAVNRIYSYLVRLEKLPNGSYSPVVAATKADELRVRIAGNIDLIAQSSHANAEKIASIIRADIAAGRANSIAKNVRFHLEFPKNWSVDDHKLQMIGAA